MRVARSTHRKDRRSKILKRAEGFWGGKSRLHRIAKLAVDKAQLSAYRDRRQRKRRFPAAVDRPHQRRRPRQRHHLQRSSSPG